MLAQVGRRLDVEIVERNQAVDFARARQITDGVGDVRLLEEVDKGHDEKLVDRFPRPGFMLQVLRCNQNGAAAESLALFYEGAALEVAGETEKRGRHGCVLWDDG